ncbi:MAG TPA: copper chaperone PCu(A)C [Hansschlegelia sp.]
MSRFLFAAVAALGVLVAGAASAHEYKAGDLLIGHPWSRATVPGAKIGGGYFTVTNHGSTPDRLLSVSAPFADKAEMHETTLDDGVAKMRSIEGGLEIKPGETLEFAPGGRHVMFVGLKQPLRQGERVKGALTFEKAGAVDVEFAVEAAGATPKSAPDMSGMDHMDHAK